MGLKLLDDYRMHNRSAALAERRKVLVEEWGLED
jgi:hypothetical protein